MTFVELLTNEFDSNDADLLHHVAAPLEAQRTTLGDDDVAGRASVFHIGMAAIGGWQRGGAGIFNSGISGSSAETTRA